MKPEIISSTLKKMANRKHLGKLPAKGVRAGRLEEAEKLADALLHKGPLRAFQELGPAERGKTRGRKRPASSGIRGISRRTQGLR